MPEVILHHYEMSPFSEKIRRILGEVVVHFPRVGYRILPTSS